MKQILKSENLEKANLLENNMPELWPMEKPEVWWRHARILAAVGKSGP